jgi:hypothetical protein
MIALAPIIAAAIAERKVLLEDIAVSFWFGLQRH